MLSIKEAKRTFYIYKAVAALDDGTNLKRIIKIQSFFNVEDLAIVLLVLQDGEDNITDIKVINNEYQCEFKRYGHNLFEDGFTFSDLEDDKDFNIKFTFEDGTNLTYVCEYIGMDITEKPITKKLPIIIDAQGYSRFGYKDYKQKHKLDYVNSDILQLSIIYDFYYKEFCSIEERELKESIKRFKALYSLEKEDFYSNI